MTRSNLFFQKNTTNQGRLNENFISFQRHNLIHSFLECNHNIKLPSIPGMLQPPTYCLIFTSPIPPSPANYFSILIIGQAQNEVAGYSLESNEKTKRSYFYFLEASQQLTPDAAPMSMSQWTDSYFHLPFRTSFQPNEFAGQAAERIISKPINEGNRYWLYMR